MVKFQQDGWRFEQATGGVPFGGVVISERAYGGHHDLSGIAPVRPEVLLVLDGAIESGECPDGEQLGPTGLVFCPAYGSRSLKVGPSGARCVHVQFGSEFLSLHPSRDRLPVQMIWVRRHRANWMATRLFSELRRQSPSAATIDASLEAMLDAVVVLATDEQAGGRKWPEWLGQVFVRLNAEFRRPPTMVELGRMAGVHPVHLARVFKAHEGSTVADYVRRLRVEYACARLGTRQPLSRVALDAGFTDQSHFTRRFKEVTGWTPGAWRRRINAPGISGVTRAWL